MLFIIVNVEERIDLPISKLQVIWTWMCEYYNYVTDKSDKGDKLDKSDKDLDSTEAKGTV